MRVYQCDSCYKIIENPYIVKMKEFYIDNTHSIQDENLIESKRKIRIHLCDECYKRLISYWRIIAKKKGESVKSNGN